MKRACRAIECAIVFFLLPASLYLVRRQIGFKIVPLIIAVGLAGWFYLRRVRPPAAVLCVPKNFGRQIREILMLFLPTAGILTILAWHLLPGKFLLFPRTAPLLWVPVMVLYPVCAALPQELLFLQRSHPLIDDGCGKTGAVLQKRHRIPGKSVATGPLPHDFRSVISCIDTAGLPD